MKGHILIAGLLWLSTAWAGDTLIAEYLSQDQAECQAVVDMNKEAAASQGVRLTDCVAVDADGGNVRFGVSTLNPYGTEAP